MPRKVSDKTQIRRLNTQLEYLKNDFQVTQEEFERSSAEHLEMLRENEELLETLRKSEEKYRSLYTAMNEGVCIHEIIPGKNGEVSDYLILDVNPAYEEMFNVKRSAVISKKTSEVFKTGIPPYLEEYVKVAITEDNCLFETSSTTSNKHFRISAFTPKKNQFVTVITDITKRKKAEIELRKSRKQLDSVVKSVPDIIYRLDKDGNIIFINESVKNYGYTPEELIGTNIFDIIHPEDKKMADNRINERRTGDRRQKSLEVRILSKSKKPIPFDIQFNEVDSEGEYLTIDAEGLYYSDSPRKKTFIGTQGLARNLSEQRKIEAEKKELEQQLFHAQKLESIGRLAGGVAHDFNNILTAIMGYSELLKMQFNDTDTSEGMAVDIILKSTERAAELTKQLLGFARGGKYDPVPINVNKIIKDTVKVSEKIFKKNIKVIYDLMKKPENIEGDRNQIIQVLTNMIINAKDSMPNGGKLYFKTENILLDDSPERQKPECVPGKYIKISITDTGTGISEDNIDQIFEPFFSTKRKGKGTGLGLATVYGIIKNHNGHIEAESMPDNGSTFIIYLPVTVKKVVKSKKKPKTIKGKATILVVDDETYVRSLAENMLQKLGYKVLLAKNGADGVRVFKKNIDDVDLVLLDLIMPKMDGRTCKQKLKKIKPDVKIVISSGYSQDSKELGLLKEDVLGFIQKPYRMHELSKGISEALK